MCQESGELVDQDMLDFVCLLNSDAHANTVYTGFDQDFLVFIARNGEGVQEEFRGTGGLDLGDIVSFGGLRSEVRDRKSGGKGRPNALKIWAQ